MMFKKMFITLGVLCASMTFAQECAPKCPAPKPCCPKPCPPVCFERGYPDNQCCIPTIYNEPADFAVGPCAWDVWLDASFTYWTAYEEGLQLALSQGSNTLGFVQTDEVSLFQSTAWKPGFKVGLGIDFGQDHWSLLAEYTWFRSSTTINADVPDPDSNTWLPLNWNPSLINSFFVNGITNITSKWRLRMDLLDVALTRPFYQGSHLIVAPFAGIRATWIRQNLNMSESIFIFAPAPPLNIVSRSNSWAIGPRGGIQGKWHLGWGFRLEGDAATSIAFTRYTKVTGDLSGPFDSITANYSNLNDIRFNNDMSLGLGWGDYFDCRRYHFDLLLTYDFQVFWNQNMMRRLFDQISFGAGGEASNLYLQGLTVKAQFDF